MDESRTEARTEEEVRTELRPRERLYRVWISYSASDDAEGRKELRQEVIAAEAMQAIQAVLAKRTGIDVLVATIEKISSLDEALRADAEHQKREVAGR